MNVDQYYHVPASPEHWTNGGTGITNFSEDWRPIYVEALKQWGKPGLVLKEKSFGKFPDYGGSMHFSGERIDTSEFYEIFWRVKKEMGL